MRDVTLLQYLFRGGLWVFFGKLMVGVSGFAMSALLARTLPTQDLATFFLANSVAVFIALTGRFGLDNTLLRIVSEKLSFSDFLSAKAVVIKGMVLVAFISTILAMFFYAGIGEWLSLLLFPNSEVFLVVGFIAIWSVALSFQFMLGEVFRALKLINMSTIFGGLLVSVLSVAFVFVAWKSGQVDSVESILELIICACLLNLVAGFYMLHFRMKQFGRYEAAKASSSEILKGSWPLWLYALSHYVLGMSGLWLVGVVGLDSEIAQYGVASRLILVVGMAVIVVNSIVPPLIARLNAGKEKEKLERIVRGTATIAAVPTVIVILVLFAYSNEIVVFVFGGAYGDAAVFFEIMILTQLVAVLVGSSTYLLMMTGHQKIIMKITVLSAVVMVGLGYCLASIYGVMAVVWVTTITIVVNQLVTLFYARKVTGIWSLVSVKQTRLFIEADLLNRRAV